MNTHRTHDHLSRRDQWWLKVGLTLGTALKRLLNREDATPGTPFPARHRA